ncbi:hybrid sensor histidine kinase/response regulator transcription factor [Motilimonas eburnea]|uniref:hybrid sensor histidine kinase/response regulator transcription factor n=1 Tax=Motilimonas eburnea TaxID=1737488 RepID=UPI001E3E1258|nr:ATP-binding protein [Motilimonas eburnea]MCE2573272.1 helix-turn-helix domain-containing protein [Motilimonas eburnea]
MVQAKFAFIALMLLFTRPIHSSPHYSFANVSLGQGLSQASVNSIVQDDTGFLWLATQEGLNRFDGHRFESIAAGVLSSQFIWRIAKGRNGHLWVLTASGLDIYDPNTQSVVRRFSPEQITGSHAGYLIRSILIDGDHAYLAGRGGVYVVSEEGDVTNIAAVAHLNKPTLDAYMVAKDGSNTLWAATNKGLYYSIAQSNDFVLFSSDLSKEDLNATCLTATNHLVWVCTESGIYQIDTQTQGVRYFSHKTLQLANPIQILYEDSAGVIWLGSKAGLFQADFIKQQAYPIDVGSNLSQLMISAIYEDKAGNLWVGSQLHGAFKLSNSARYFNLMDEKDGLLDSSVMALNKLDNSQLQYFTANSTYNLVSTDGQVIDKTILTTTNGSKLGVIVHTLRFNDKTWLAGDFGIATLSLQSNQVTSYDLAHFGQVDRRDFVSELMVFNGTLWAFSFESGLLRYSQHTDQFLPFKPSHWPSHQPFLAKVSSATQNKDKLWLVTVDNQLIEMDKSSFQLTELAASGALVFDGVYDHLVDRSNRALWLASRSGVIRFDLNTRQFQSVNASVGSGQARAAYSVFEDEYGNIWSNAGASLLHIDPNSLQIKRYTLADGMPIQEFNAKASLPLSNGRFLMAGINGLLEVDPALVYQNDNSASAQVTHIEVKQATTVRNDESPWLAVPFRYEQALQLEQDSAIRLHFADFTFNSATRFRYKMQGIDSSWNYTELGQHSVTYHQLPPGNHTFVIETESKSGEWRGNQKLMLGVKTYFYQTIWFSLLVGLLLIMLGALIARSRARYLQQQNFKLESKVAARTQEIKAMLDQRVRLFANVSHEFRTPLTLILSPLTSALSDNAPATISQAQWTVIERNARRLLLMTDKLLKLTQTGAREATAVTPLDPVMQHIKLQYQDLAQHQQVQICFAGQEGYCVAASADELQLIIQNVVSNGIKYNRPGGHVQVKWYVNNDMLVIAVADDGYGIDEADVAHIFEPFYREKQSRHPDITGTGLGLALVKETLLSIGGDITVESTSDQGCEFIISLPLAQSQQADMPCFELQPLTEPSPSAISPPIHLPNTATDIEDILLIVEDNVELSDYLVSVFCNHYQCLVASDGQQALAIATDTIPNVILCDWQIPNLTGLEVCDAIRDNDKTCHIPFLLVTAKVDDDSRKMALVHQVTDFITKPFDIDELKLKVDNLNALTHGFSADKNATANVLGTHHDLKDKDQEFVNKLEHIFKQHFHDSDFSVVQCAEQMFMSSKQLQRKIKGLLGVTPSEMLREYRLQQSNEILRSGIAISEVAFMCGFSSQSYFSTLYKARFGITPKKYQDQVERG